MNLKPYTLALAVTTAFSPVKAQDTFPPGHPIYDDEANGYSYLSFHCPVNGVYFIEARQWSAKELFRAVSEPRPSDPLHNMPHHSFAISPDGTFLSLDGPQNRQKIQTGQFPVGYHKDDVQARMHQQVVETCLSIS